MDIRAFTQEADGRLNRLVTTCGICEAYIPSPNSNHPTVLQFNALWDTGATVSAISTNVVEALRLTSFSMGKVYHAQGESDTNKYKINMLLPNRIALSTMTVLEGKLKGCDVLIGMDIISLGDFAITNRDGKTLFSFQIPSTHYYDFVKQINNGKISNKKKK